MKIAVDAMGGDNAPREIVAGAYRAAAESGLNVILVGRQEIVNSELRRLSRSWSKLPIEVVNADEVIEMCEPPAEAVRKKRNSSICLAARMVKQGQASAVVSAGSTGAAVAAALLNIGRISGIDRPAIATPFPNITGTAALLDSGANVDAKPRHFVQNAIMGTMYARHILRIANPRVGILNIGEEDSKGNEQTQAALALLRRTSTINFIGNVEGRDIPAGTVDVVVCDGFVGNVVLKLAEGLGTAFLRLIKANIRASGIMARAGAMMMMPALTGLRKKMDYSEYGGAPLLGVKGGFIICHGSSKAKAIQNAIRLAADFSATEMVELIAEAVKEESLAHD
ncbi:MAG: phosphate acyltransferase PlsX [Negativicutes bacterium]|nr:phosphate acyltransferase PlsX [Negativicutes bacterium]